MTFDFLIGAGWSQWPLTQSFYQQLQSFITPSPDEIKGFREINLSSQN